VKEIVFDAISASIAELSIPEGPNDFGVRSSGKLAVNHDVGVYGAPRWRIRQQLSPDDAWEVETLTSGELLSAHRSVPERFESTYFAWAEGSRAESGAALLDALPPGSYLVVRSSIEPHRQPSVILGNERVPNPPANMLVQLEEGPFYGLVLGPDAMHAPITTHPLVSLIAINYVGRSYLHGAFFFDCLAREESAAPTEAGAP